MKVEIYGTENCAYCHQAVSLCQDNQIDYSYINVREGNNLALLEERLGIRPRTVPQIFRNGQHILDGFFGLKKEIFKN